MNDDAFSSTGRRRISIGAAEGEVRALARPFTQPKGLRMKVLSRRSGEAALG
jgi:hypothetical protein